MEVSDLEQIKKKLGELERDIENLEKNVLYLSVLISLVAQRSGITVKELKKLMKLAHGDIQKSHEVIKFLKIMKQSNWKRKG